MRCPLPTRPRRVAVQLARRAFRPAAVVAAGVLIAATVPAPGQPQEAAPAEPSDVRGFPAAMEAARSDREARARAVPSVDSLEARMQLLSEEPHVGGTPASRRVAERILERFRSFGLDARLETFRALMPLPDRRELELVEPVGWAATLEEPPVPGDEDTWDSGQLPPANMYSADGDVTAEVVFVNYGLPEDYATLDSLGISVEGKIVLAKYGRSWRGIKPKVAAEEGAVGAILYSDPEDDGYAVKDVYPEGPMRPWGGVQRGSVLDMPTYPGDPLTPGWAHTEGARTLPRDSARTIMEIPVLPISYGEAREILEQLGGPVAPSDDWKGALPLTYHVGPGPAVARLALEYDWEIRPFSNVVATIPGCVWPDQWVLYGNHHDAWVNGAQDPISGMVALEEAARALATLRADGWCPRRTVVLAGWDAEEWGLLGSVEWGEAHADELREKAVAYLNTDSNSRGWIGLQASHSLEEFWRQVARDVADPTRADSSVLAAALAHRAAEAGEADAVDGAAVEWSVDALGSGSDYTVFIDHLGIASTMLYYGGGTPAGVYHSAYDTYEFYRRFLDPGFDYERLLARTSVTAVLRLADAPVLPFEFGRVVDTYRGYVAEIDSVATGKGMEGLDLLAVSAALDELEAASARFEDALAGLEGLDAADLRARSGALGRANRLIYRTERALTSEEGLPGRPWFRHLLYAPGYYTGYGVKTMPGIREAVEDRPDVAVANAQASRVAAALERYAGQVEEAARALEAALE